MEIKERKVTVRELAEGYVNSDAEGVRGFGGRLDIRPQYQREFIYKDEQRDEVIRTVYKGFPLNVMYWVDRGEESEKKRTAALRGDGRATAHYLPLRVCR